MRPITSTVALLLAQCLAATAAAGDDDMQTTRVAENVYRGELVAYPGPWAFQLPKSAIILVSDRELEALADPDHRLNLACGHEPWVTSLREICERARTQGQRTVILAFDQFFAQYRPGQEGPRRLTPDKDEFIQRIAAISKFMEPYGLGLELSLLSPLEIGPAYAAATGESGLWMHYRKGVRDPKTGAFSVQLWQQRQWANNKGTINLEDAGVRAFAFRENRVGNTACLAVKPEDIVEIKDGLRVEVMESLRAANARRITVCGSENPAGREGLDRVLVVQTYRTPEMDYFGDKARPYLTALIDNYSSAGVRLNALYSDEMHIQQDWNYFGHHDNGEFALRYVSPGLAKTYAARYGAEYSDFAKYLVYFCYGQEDSRHDIAARAGMMHVFGASPEEIARTALFRSRYYELLQNGVVDLFVGAKRHAEQRFGHMLEARAHATWAESPTIDAWDTGRRHHYANAYEYTSNFIWSCTVHQAAAACHDYFKWGDFLTGNGNDHAECGWYDRNYYGQALACSTGILNDVPYSYAAHWGMPHELARRRQNVCDAYGVGSSTIHGLVQDMQHRDTPVLMLYPLDLVAEEERFGSWMTQYGYANYVTAAKLLERGKVTGGAIELAGRRFTTLVALFEPFPSEALLDLMERFAAGGGRVIWSSAPPFLSREGRPVLERWKKLFGVEYRPQLGDGMMAPGREVVFEGPLAGVPRQSILTHFLVDCIYPIEPLSGTLSIASVQGQCVGSTRAVPGSGNAIVLGFRPRDDQSCSLGSEVRTWFEILRTMGAYRPSGKFADTNDNPDVISRTGESVACRFPNGAVSLAPHYRQIEEQWSGGFARNAAEDEQYLKNNPPPSEDIVLRNLRVDGHTITCTATRTLSFRVDAEKRLAAFAAHGCREVTIDGKHYEFASQPLETIAWGPVLPSRRVPGGAVVQFMAAGQGDVRIPAEAVPEGLSFVAEGQRPGSRGSAVPPVKREHASLHFTLTPEVSGKWIYGVPASAAPTRQQ